MNYQSHRECLQIIDAEEAAQLLGGINYSLLEYYAWPETFGSTAGPFKGAGGQSVSTFTIEAWSDGRRAVIFCQGEKLKIVDDFKPGDVRL